MSYAVRVVRRLTRDDTRFRLHNWLCSHDLTSRVYAALQPKLRGGMVSERTDLVIEGFPRSANTYALAAFTCANGPGTVVASHLHAASSVAQGVRRGLPVIVVLRDPLDACASLLQRQPVRASSALRAYVRFHERVRPLAGDVVLSDFAVTTGAFGATLEAVNRRFGTTFSPYEHTPDNEAWCREFVIEADRRDQGEVRESTVALPQASRRERREPVVDAVAREASLLEQARRLYQDLRAHAVTAEGH
jgi:hypothetical protein